MNLNEQQQQKSPHVAIYAHQQAHGVTHQLLAEEGFPLWSGVSSFQLIMHASPGPVRFQGAIDRDAIHS
jgi:hypothetical protein